MILLDPKEDFPRVLFWYLYWKCVRKGVKQRCNTKNDTYCTETWRTGSPLMLNVILVNPKDDTLRVCCWCLYWKCVRNERSRKQVLLGLSESLLGDLENKVLPNPTELHNHQLNCIPTLNLPCPLPYLHTLPYFIYIPYLTL